MKYIIQILLAISLIVTIYFLLNKDIELIDYKRKHDRLINERDSIRFKAYSLKARLDSLDKEYKHKTDSFNKEKTNLIVSYENYIKSLGDISVISDDSVTIYISNRLQDWGN